MVLRKSSLVTSVSGPYFLQMTWSCWLHQSMTSSSHWIGLQPSVMLPKWESVPPNLMPYFSARKRSQMKESKHLGVLFTTEETMEQEIDRQIPAASAVMRTLHWSIVVKRELSWKAKFSIYRSIFVPTLTYGHMLWVVTERTGLRVQAAEMSCLLRVAGLSLRGLEALPSGRGSE